MILGSVGTLRHQSVVIQQSSMPYCWPQIVLCQHLFSNKSLLHFCLWRQQNPQIILVTGCCLPDLYLCVLWFMITFHTLSSAIQPYKPALTLNNMLMLQPMGTHYPSLLYYSVLMRTATSIFPFWTQLHTCNILWLYLAQLWHNYADKICPQIDRHSGKLFHNLWHTVENAWSSWSVDVKSREME